MYKAVHTIKREVTTNQLGVKVGVGFLVDVTGNRSRRNYFNAIFVKRT